MNSEPATLACFALKEEAAAFRKTAASRSGIHILVTGIGRRNAEGALRKFLATHSPGLVLTCGFAGGLNPALAIGAVIFETVESTLSQRLLAAGAKPATLHCAEHIATTIAEKQRLRQSTGADAVEMESGAIHAVCRERAIPCATVRAISDVADEDLPLDFNQLAGPDLSLNYGKLAVAILKSPRKIGALLRLQKNCRCAAERLAEVLAKVTEGP
jgi:adenosylhomocysteine nucleosidase